MFYLLLPTNKLRNDFMQYLENNNILSVFHYVPLHSSIMGSRLSENKIDCPITTDISSRLVRLPFYNNLSISSQEYIIEKIKEF